MVNLVRKGTFGWADFFEPVMDSITSGGDYYLLANDFPSYIEAQVSVTDKHRDTCVLMMSCLTAHPVIPSDAKPLAIPAFKISRQTGLQGIVEHMLLQPTLLQESSSKVVISPDWSPIRAQERVDETYKDTAKWTHMSIMSTAGSGFFSSDRTINEYAKEIWRTEPCHVPAPED